MTEALRLAEAAVKSAPRVATLHDTYAQALVKNHDFPAAARETRTAVQLEPDTAKWRIRLAAYLLQAGDTVTARKELTALDNARLNTSQLALADQETFADLQKQLKRQ